MNNSRLAISPAKAVGNRTVHFFVSNAFLASHLFLTSFFAMREVRPLKQPSMFILLFSCPAPLRRAHACLGSKLLFLPTLSDRLNMCFERHALQYAGLPILGLKETIAVLPQSAHLISNILFWIMMVTSSSYEARATSLVSN